MKNNMTFDIGPKTKGSEIIECIRHIIAWMWDNGFPVEFALLDLAHSRDIFNHKPIKK